jgi:hypothetical protein
LEADLAAERAGRKIVVEIKSFLGHSLITEFYSAVGQYLTCEVPPINRHEDFGKGEKPHVVQQPESKIESKTKTEDMELPPEKLTATQSNIPVPTLVTLEMKHAKVANTVFPTRASGKIEGVPVEFYRLAASEA